MPIIEGVIDPEERLVLCALRRQWLPVCTVSGVEVLEQLGPGTGVVLKVGKIGLKNAMEEAYKQSYVEVSLVDRDPKMQYYNKEIKAYCDWTVVAKPQRTRFAKETEHETSVASWAQYLVFDHEIILPLSREQILQRPGSSPRIALLVLILWLILTPTLFLYPVPVTWSELVHV